MFGFAKTKQKSQGHARFWLFDISHHPVFKIMEREILFCSIFRYVKTNVETLLYLCSRFKPTINLTKPEEPTGYNWH